MLRTHLVIRLLPLGILALALASANAQDAGVPPQNRRELRDPPPRPTAESVQADARKLFEAIVHDDPSRAADFFFPREAFIQVKAMQKPERYWERLYRRYEQDVHTLHRTTPDLERAVFERLDLGRRGGWVSVGEEGNRLPYWAARHTFLLYRVGNELRRIEVRVLISWGERWHLIHLSEFR